MDKIELTIFQLKNLFKAGMEREEENFAVEVDYMDDEERTAPDFGEYMQQVHNIKID